MIHTEKDYEIISEIGTGGTCVVYKANDLKHSGKEVALKVFNELFDSSLKNDANIKGHQRYINEFTIIKELLHENFVDVYNWINFNGKFAYSMELITGTMLVNFIVDKSISESEADSFSIQLVSAIKAVHSIKDPNNPGAHILHRDIKPENIMVSNNKMIKLIDFGFAKKFDENLTNDSTILGTPEYIPPEYMSSGKNNEKPYYEVRSDIYQCGIVIWEMYAKKRRRETIPIDNEKIKSDILNMGITDPHNMEKHRIQNEYIQINKYLQNSKFKLPYITLDDKAKERKINKIISKATAYSPDDRYSNAHEMLEAIKDRKVIYADFSIPNKTYHLLQLSLIVFLLVSIGVANILFIVWNWLAKIITGIF